MSYRVDVWHNILWSRYKAVVFTRLHEFSKNSAIRFVIHQIAETESDRVALSPIDTSYHQYPYKLQFEGVYSKIPRLKLYWKLGCASVRTNADLTVLAGYHKCEYWLQMLILRLRHRSVAVFCDSTAYDNPQTALKTLLKRLFFSQCKVVFCYGTRSGEYVHSFGVPYRKIVTRCQAAALPANYSSGEVIARKRELGAHTDSRFLYVGRLAPEKDLGVLLSAFKIVREKLPKALLSIVGQGPEQNALERLCEKLEIVPFVKFAGPKFDGALTEEYLSATALILPSRSEPWGLVANEALSYGCPVIASDRCGCVPELIEEGRTGFVMRSGDVNDLAAKMVLISGWPDPLVTAQRCLTRIAPFTPERSARNILAGCLFALDAFSEIERLGFEESGIFQQPQSFVRRPNRHAVTDAELVESDCDPKRL